MSDKTVIVVPEEDYSAVPSEKPVSAVEQLLKRNQELLATPASPFPESFPKLVWYDKDLEQRPFVITSETMYRTNRFGQEVVNFHFRLVDLEKNTLSESYIAQLSGRYTINQIRNMTANELIGSYVWTLKANTQKEPYKWEDLGNGQKMPLYPRMLAIFDLVADTKPEKENPF